MRFNIQISILFLGIMLCLGIAKGVTARPVKAQSLSGDANNDGRVDGIDFSVWLSHYDQNINGVTNGDFNNSGKVDGIDFSIWLNNYGRTIATSTPTRAATSTPQPTSAPGTRTPTPAPTFCYVKIAGYVYNMQPAVGIKLTDQVSSKTQTHSRGDFRCGTLTSPTDVTAVYLDKHKKLGCWQRVAQYIVTPPAPVDATCQ